MTWTLLQGDCMEVMQEMEANSVDAVVTDPPYDLTSINKRWSGKDVKETPAMQTKEGSVWARKARGFMGKEWDGTGIAFNVAMWREVLRILKPGGHLLSFGGDRTEHRMKCAIEDAGFEIRTTMAWVYGSGFPKSLDIGKVIDKKAGVEREITGTYKTPDGRDYTLEKSCQNGYAKTELSMGKDVGAERRVTTAPTTPEGQQWDGWGTALKPAMELICMARKPLAEKTVAGNVLEWGTGGINIDGCRVGTEVISQHGRNKNDTPAQIPQNEYNPGNSWTGRFPANFIHDGSEEVLAGFPQTTSGSIKAGQPAGVDMRAGDTDNTRIGGRPLQPKDISASSGSAARFFYCAKASKAERNMGLDDKEENTVDDGRQKAIDNPFQRGKTPRKNTHPTVKPLSLMRYLCRLITPPGGRVLDPFAGSGTTVIAALQEGFNAIGIEKEQEYAEIARCRIEAAEKVDKQQTIFSMGGITE